MKKRIIKIIALLLIVAACDNKLTTEKQIIKYSHYDLFGKLIKTELWGLEIKKTGNSLTNTYYDLNDSLNNHADVDFNMDYDSTIVYNGEVCQKKGQKTFKINDTTITVKRYLYDIVNSSDDELDLYFIENYGLIGLKSAWLDFELYDRGRKFDKILMKRLRKDTTGFFRFDGLPKPI